MAKQWHIDGVSALIVDGVRYTLQTFEYRNFDWSSVSRVDLWTKAADQNGDGFVIEAPFVLAGCKWAHWDTWAISGGNVDYDEATFYEGTFAHYGTAGMTWPQTPPPYTLTVLMPHTTRKAGRNLVFDPLGAKAVLADWTMHNPGVELWINGVEQVIMAPGAHDGNSQGYYANNWQGYALGQPSRAA